MKGLKCQNIWLGFQELLQFLVPVKKKYEAEQHLN